MNIKNLFQKLTGLFSSKKELDKPQEPRIKVRKKRFRRPRLTYVSDLSQRFRLLGYYSFPNQNMHPETIYVEDAEKLSEGFSLAINGLRNNRHVSDEIKEAIDKATVFIFKDERSWLYAYFTLTGNARITKVMYNKRRIRKVPIEYKRWFHLGEYIKVFRPQYDMPPELIEQESDEEI